MLDENNNILAAVSIKRADGRTSQQKVQYSGANQMLIISVLDDSGPGIDLSIDSAG